MKLRKLFIASLLPFIAVMLIACTGNNDPSSSQSTTSSTTSQFVNTSGGTHTSNGGGTQESNDSGDKVTSNVESEEIVSSEVSNPNFDVSSNEGEIVSWGNY